MATANNDAPLAAELKLIAGLTVKIAEPLARYTSMKIGGPADYFIEVENDAALANLLGVLSRHQENFCLLGNGSNVLISDRGVRGAVIHLAGEFKQAQWREEDETARLNVGAACAVAQLVRASGAQRLLRFGICRRDSRQCRRCFIHERGSVRFRVRESRRSGRGDDAARRAASFGARADDV